NMLQVATGGSMPTDIQLQAVSAKAAGYLVAGIRAAAVVPTYYSQVAAAMVNSSISADRSAVASAFVHHGILSLPAAASASASVAAVAGVPMIDSNEDVD